tara:strand:+ start:1355 stop:1909 length:555 start_codon:yes stop_codon:yes gene_type:complete
MSYEKFSTQELIEKLEEGQELPEHIWVDFPLDELKLDVKTLKKMKKKLEKLGGIDDDLPMIEFPSVGQTKQLNFQNTYEILKTKATKNMKIYREQQVIEKEMVIFGEEEDALNAEIILRHKKELEELKEKIQEFQEENDWYNNMEETKTKEQILERQMITKELEIMKNKENKFKDIIKKMSGVI